MASHHWSWTIRAFNLPILRAVRGLMVLFFVSRYHAHDPQSREKYDYSDRENFKRQKTSWKYGVHGAPPLVELKMSLGV